MKQLSPFAIGCKTQIVLICENIFKAASLSCHLIDSKNSLITKLTASLFDKNLPKNTNHLNKLLHRIERTKMTYFLWRKRAI